jgi:hypothetical protein
MRIILGLSLQVCVDIIDANLTVIQKIGLSFSCFTVPFSGAVHALLLVKPHLSASHDDVSVSNEASSSVDMRASR